MTTRPVTPEEIREARDLLGRALDRIKELNSQIAALKAQPTNPDTDRIAALEAQVARIPGLLKGNQDAEKKVDLAIKLIDQGRTHTAEATRLRGELIELQKKLKELEKGPAAATTAPEAGAAEEDEEDEAASSQPIRMDKDPPNSRRARQQSKERSSSRKPLRNVWDDGEPRAT